MVRAPLLPHFTGEGAAAEKGLTSWGSGPAGKWQSWHLKPGNLVLPETYPPCYSASNLC